MFKSRTLFVIGAGASCEAGLPAGNELKSHIAALLKFRFGKHGIQDGGDHDIYRSLQSVAQKLGRSAINNFIEKSHSIAEVVPAAAISIDNYLDAHRGDRSLELCGKLGIVRSILNAEAKSKLSPIPHGNGDFRLNDISNSWYMKFFQILHENVDRKEILTIFENVSIITFNYDRCIERFLPQALRNYYRIDESEAQDVLSRLNIIHPYGSIGTLPWNDRKDGVEFGAERVDLLKCVDRIKTFTEGLDDSSIIDRMRSLVADAETIVFLGFAFHPMNMDMISIQGTPSTKRVFATIYGMSAADGKEIEYDIFRMINSEDSRSSLRRSIKTEIVNMTCFDFFNHYFRSLSSQPR